MITPGAPAAEAPEQLGAAVNQAPEQLEAPEQAELDLEPTPIRRPEFWRGIGVVSGWYAAAAVAVLVWVRSLDDTPTADCGMWLCLSPQAGAMLGLLLAGPVLLAAGLVLSVAALSPAYRRTGSWLAAGNLAAALGLLGGALVVAVVLFGIQR
jgi:hypothetical protein